MYQNENTYMYRAALYCVACGEWNVADCKARGVADNGDSDTYPQGPYADGGGEADCPQHCDMCGVFLENPLTADGVQYVADALADGTGDPAVLATWRDFYAATLAA